MISMNIDFANLQLQYQTYKADIDKNISKVLNNSNYIIYLYTFTCIITYQVLYYNESLMIFSETNVTNYTILIILSMNTK